MESLQQLQQQQLQHQQQLEQHRQEILSLFGAFEERELQPFDAPSRGVDELPAADQLQPVREPDDLQLPAPAEPPRADGGTLVDVAVKAAPEVIGNVPVKRKRGRPPKNQSLLNGKSNVPPPPKVDEEEDVCFICFDGGELVLCDRRGCPKAYHPACIKRDASFFNSRSRWNCGWHICSSCEKAAYYMCYTCTYSLCKNCTKDADYVCIRGTKGLCGTCRKTIMLIENIPQENQEMVQVDFDDKTSWEYLFKVYWVILKEKLSLTIDELTKAKSPWEESSLMNSRMHNSGELNYCNDGGRYGSDNSFKYQPPHTSRGRKARERPKLLNLESPNEQVNNAAEGPSSCEHPQWASKELLEFVRHMKNGDLSVLTQFEVQALLLEYIRKNNLRDPRRRCQIVCDSRLMNLFGKTIVGHFEMLKLLDSHFLVKENPRIDGFIREAIVDPANMDVNMASYNQLGFDGDKKRKTRKKLDERVPQVNPDDYAAIDVHNICLIYLRLDMMENLLDDLEKFHDKVVGSFVRIKVATSDQKQDTFRLVQVIGTSRVAETYKIGARVSDVKLEILNLDKKEVVSINDISNQEFSEDECQQLQQSVKSGLMKRLTVGDIQQKALALREVKVKEWLETELLRLNHLRDRASEKGHKKELRECVERIQLLNSPEERQRRLHEFPDVHADKKEDGDTKPINVSNRKRKLSSLPKMETDVLNTSRSRSQKKQSIAQQSIDVHGSNNEGDLSGQRQESNFCWNQQTARRKRGIDRAGISISLVCGLGNPAMKPEPAATQISPEVLSSAIPAVVEQSVSDIEGQKMWHYQDPRGKIQGPFTMAQLRKWNMSGHFPHDLRIWRMDDKQENSLLLTEALKGHYNKELTLLPQEAKAVTGERDINLNGPSGLIGIQKDMDLAQSSGNVKEGDSNSPSKANNEDVTSDGQGCHPPAETTFGVGSDSGGGQIMTVSQVWDSLNDDNLPIVQPQLCDSLQIAIPGKPNETPPRVTENHESCQNSRKLSLFLLAEALANDEHSSQKQGSGDDYSNHLSSQNWKTPVPVISSSNGWDSNANTASLDKQHESSEETNEIDFPDLPSSTPAKPSNEDLEDRASAEDKQCMPSNVTVCDSTPSWSSASNLVAGPQQVKEVTNEWNGAYTSVSTKPVDQWDSTLVSDVPGNHAATLASSSGNQLMDPSPTHPLPDASNWHTNFTEATDFAALAEESVSDLLAEVEAMENGLPSPTSIMKCSQDLNESGKDECFSPIEVFSPTAPGPVKSSGFSSSSDLLVTSQPAGTGHEPNAASNPTAELADARRTSHRHSSSSAEVEGGLTIKQTDGSGSQWKQERSSDLHRPAPSTTNWHVSTSSPSLKAAPTVGDNNWGPVQGSPHLSWEGTSSHGHNTSSTDWDSPRQSMFQRNTSFGSGSGAGSPGTFGNNQSRHSGGSRYSSPRDRERERERERDRDRDREREHQGIDQGGYNRSRSNNTWSGRPYSGTGSGGGHRQPSKGQRVCKFYESGHCKKGASCSYFHP